MFFSKPSIVKLRPQDKTEPKRIDLGHISVLIKYAVNVFCLCTAVLRGDVSAAMVPVVTMVRKESR